MRRLSVFKPDMPFLAHKGTDKARLGVFSLSERTPTIQLRFLPTADPTVWPKPALQSNMKSECMCVHHYTEREGASTPAIHCRHSPWLHIWDQLRIWARDLLLSLLQHSEQDFANPLMRHPSTASAAPSPPDPSFPTSHRPPEPLLFRLFRKLFPILSSQKQWAK